MIVGFFISKLSIVAFDTNDRKILCRFESSDITGALLTRNVPDNDVTEDIDLIHARCLTNINNAFLENEESDD